MRVIRYERYGGPEVATVADAPEPSPGDGEVLVRVAAASVGAADAASRSGTPWFARLFSGLRRPRHPVLGSDFAGTVVALGDRVEGFDVGDRVVGASGPRLGGHAEYVIARADSALVRLPEPVSEAHAVALADGGLTALPFLRDTGRMRADDRVLVIGASGSVGSHAVQLARRAGAHVTAVTSTPNLELVQRLGAQEAIDYREQDVTAGDHRWDIVFDTVGGTDWRRAARILTPGGRYLRAVPSGAVMIRTLMRSRRAAIAFTGLRPDAAKRPDLAELVAAVAAGELDPLIDSVHAFDEIAAAYARVDSGRKRGTVVLDPRVRNS